MALNGTTAVRIQLEVLLGTKPARQDTEEEATFRAEISSEIAELQKQGVVVDIPSV